MSICQGVLVGCGVACIPNAVAVVSSACEISRAVSPILCILSVCLTALEMVGFMGYLQEFCSCSLQG